MSVFHAILERRTYSDRSGEPPWRTCSLATPNPHIELTRELARDLESKGLSVWWDAELVAGKSFRQRIIQELKDCKAAIVIWTPESIQSDFVVSEAERARKEGKLIQVRTDRVRPDDLATAI